MVSSGTSRQKGIGMLSEDMIDKDKWKFLEDMARGGDFAAKALCEEVDAAEGQQHRTKQALKKKAKLISQIVNASIEFVDGENAYMARINHNALEYDVMISEILQLDKRLEGLYYIAERMIEREG